MLRINKQRLLTNLASLANIGKTPDGGVSRPALSEADLAGREWFKQKIEEAGFQLSEDSAGNISGILPSENPNAQTIIIGSHLDSVPNGGRFDGALGVLSAFEVAQTIKHADIKPKYHLEVMSFTDEEGTHIGLLGSRAVTNQLSEADFANPRNGTESFEEGLARIGLTREGVLAAKRNPNDIAGYVEIHIEQGTRLEKANIDIGVVTSMVGIHSYMLTFTGQAAHAGTTPMNERKDALLGASAFVQQARQIVFDTYSPGVVNCGIIHAQPGAYNIVPAEVKLGLEFRHGSDKLIKQMDSDLLHLARSTAEEFGLAFSYEETTDVKAAPMSEDFVTVIEAAAESLNLSHTRLMSFAGHDAQAMSAITPAALIFVPSVDGISHNPKEYTTDSDIIKGASTLLQTVLSLSKVP